MLHITSLLHITDTRYWHTCGKHHDTHDCGKQLQKSLTNIIDMCVKHITCLVCVMLGLTWFLSGRICLWILSFSITHTLWSAECGTGWMDMGVGLPWIALDAQYICIILTNSQNPDNELREFDYLAFCFDFFFHFYVLV